MSGIAPRPRPGSSTGRTVAVALAFTALVLAVAVVASTAGPSTVLAGAGPVGEREIDSLPTEDASAAPAETGDDGNDDPGGHTAPEWLSRLIDASGWVALGAAFVLVAGWALQRRQPRRRRRRRADDEEILLDPAAPARALTTEIVEDADDQVALLAAGTPRNAIVACWQRFEVQAARAGVPRSSWETSTEFTLRLLALVEADREAVSALSRLYREARFSDHELDEESRQTAREAVGRIHDRLSHPAHRGAV